jgi:endoglucanase
MPASGGRTGQAARFAACILGLCLSALSARGEGVEFRRGIGVTHAMAWAPVEPAPSRAFVFPPFAAANAFARDELRTLRLVGFDFVRLAVDPGPFLQFQGARRDQLDRMLMDRVDLILASGLSVVVDFHPSDIHPEYRADALTRGVNAPLFQDYLRLLVRTAELLAGLPAGRVALEIMNEPPVRSAAWRPMLEAAYAAIRSRAPRLWLVLDGGDEPAPDNVKALARFAKDPAVLFSFHYYEPYQFTHQGASWNAARHLADVPYPARARPLQDSLQATADAIAATRLSQGEKLLANLDARRRLESYRGSGFDRAAIAASFDRVAAWAKEHGVAPTRIFLGEFGATDFHAHGARAAERVRWFRDVREEAEARGFIWAVWAYRGGGGFALARDESSTELDPAIMRALGLSPARHGTTNGTSK